MVERAEKTPHAALASTIETMEQRIATQPAHEVLGVAPTADRRAVRDAYFVLCQQFHPDAYAGQDIGPLRVRLARVFQGLTTAYETLAPRRRSGTGVEPTATPSATQPRATASGVATVAPAASPEPRASSSTGAAPPPEPAPSADRSGRYAISQPRSARPATPSSSPSSSAVTAPAPIAPRAPVAPSAPSSSTLANVLRTADEALARGDIAAATNALAVATRLAPGDPALRARADELAKLRAAAQARAYVAQAVAEEQTGQWQRAAVTWQSAALGGHDEGALLTRAAHAQLRAGTDAETAVALARRATRAAPDSADAHAILAWALAVNGVHAEARAALETALRIDPGAPLANNLLRRIGRRG